MNSLFSLLRCTVAENLGWGILFGKIWEIPSNYNFKRRMTKPKKSFFYGDIFSDQFCEMTFNDKTRSLVATINRLLVFQKFPQTPL
jgi:hypothetical protein